MLRGKLILTYSRTLKKVINILSLKKVLTSFSINLDKLIEQLIYIFYNLVYKVYKYVVYK